MGKKITVGEGHTVGIKTDHRNGQTTPVENQIEVRPVMDGYHNETVRDRYRFGRDFLTIFPEDLSNLVRNGKMTLNEWRILLYLMSILEKGNATFTNLDEIANDLGMHKTHVCSNLQKLIKRNLIIQSKLKRQKRSGGQTMVFQIPLCQMNYNLCYNGQIKDYKSLRPDHPQITMTDGETLLDPHKETERQRQKRLEEQRNSLFPEFFSDEEEEPPYNEDEQPPIMDDEYYSAIESFENQKS